MHEKIKKVISILIVFFLATMIFSTTISAKWFNSETTLKEKIERLNQKTNDLINQLSEQQSKDSSKETNKFLANRQPTTSLIKTLQSYTALRANDPTLRFYTNYNGQEKETRLKLFFETKIDVDGENGNDIGVRYTILPGIARPLSLSINFKLTIRQLTGFNQLDENAFFEGYAELYFPGILVKNLSGYRVRFGYQSPEGEKTPEKCDVIFKFIPNLIYPRKKAGFHFAMIPDAATTGKEKLNLLSGLAEMNGDTVVSEVYSKTLYNPAVETEISLSRSKSLGKRIFEFERQRSGDSQVDMYIAITEGANSTYAYVKEVPELVTLSSKSGRNGFIEFDAHGKAVDEIGVCDDFENPINKAYFSNMFTKAKIEWNRDRLFLLKKGKANVSIYTEGEGVSFNVHLEDEGNGSLDFSALSEDAIIDVFMELDLSEGYFSLKHSMYNISLSLLGNGPDNGVLDASLTLKKTEDKPFEIYFNGLKEGNAEILLAGKSFEIYNLDIKMINYLPSFNGEYSITMDHLEKTKEGSIITSFSIVKEDKNISGSCRFDIVHGVQITNLVLKFNNFVFHRGDIDETGSITKWYNFSINITDVEWHDYGDWGYVLIKGDNSAFFSFDSTYWDDDELIGTISGAIKLKTTSDVFNISWDTVDGNKTYYFDGSGVVGLYDFHFWMKDKIDVSIPEISGIFELNTHEQSGELVLYIDDSSAMLKVDIEEINVTDLFDITLKGVISLDASCTASGTIGIGWNETGKWFFDTDFNLNCEGTFEVTNFLLSYKESLVNISIGELLITGDLDVNIGLINNTLKITADAGMTNIVLSDASISTGIHMYPSSFMGVSTDIDITFNGSGYVEITYINDTVLVDAAVYDSSDIRINTFWFLVPGMFIEINLENLYIGGPTTIIFNVNTSQDVPLSVQLTTDMEITADTIYLGYTSYLQIFIRDFVGDSSNGYIAVGFNKINGKPMIELNQSSLHIGVFDLVLIGTSVATLTNIAIEGSAYLEVFLDLDAFAWVYLKGIIIDDTTISLEDLDISVILEPGKLDLILENNLLNYDDNLYVYVFGYSSGWITIRINGTDLLKIMGIVDVWFDMYFSNDGTISAVLDAKEVTGVILIKDAIRAAGELNGLVKFSVNIDQTDDTITISDLSLNITGEINGVIQAKTNETNWIPIFPFTSTGQVILIAPDPKAIKKRIKTTQDEATLTMEAWYTPPFSLSPTDVGPYTYTISYDDGTPDYEITTSDTEIHVTHTYPLGEYDPGVVVTATDPGYEPVSDTLHVEVIHGNYVGIPSEGPSLFLFEDVEEDGKIHTWFTVKNNDEDDHILEWEAYVDDPPNDESNYFLEPSNGVLNPGETKRVNVSFTPPPDNKDERVDFIVNNSNYEEYETYGEYDNAKFTVDIQKRYYAVMIWPLGDIYLPDLGPGESITASFWIWNLPDIEGPLNWDISNYPENGTWSFSKTSGTIPVMGTEVVHFTVTAPDEEGMDLGGEIKIISSDDPGDSDSVIVHVKTRGGSQGPGDDNVTITENENGNISIRIGGYIDINVDNLVFEINGVSGMLNGHFFFESTDSYVYINFTKNDVSSLSVDGSAEFSIENFKFAYGDGINIEISKVITGGFDCEQGKSGSFHIS